MYTNQGTSKRYLDFRQCKAHEHIISIHSNSQLGTHVNGLNCLVHYKPIAGSLLCHMFGGKLQMETRLWDPGNYSLWY